MNSININQINVTSNQMWNDVNLLNEKKKMLKKSILQNLYIVIIKEKMIELGDMVNPHHWHHPFNTHH